MRTTTFLLAVTLVPATVLAGGEQFPVGARFAGMGHAGITLVDLWSVSSNQAGLAGLERPVAGAYYQQHWLSPDLAMQGLAFALPVGKGTFAVSANSFGNTLYAQRTFGLAYAMKLNDGLRVGVQLDYLNIRLGDDYGSTSAITAELGVQAKLTEHLWIGAHLYNPNRAKLGGPYEEKAPTVVRAGLGYTFSEQVTLTGEVSKDIDRPEEYHAGIEYRPISALFLRTGISTGPTKAHFGVGVRVKQLDVDVAAVMRSQLGLTPMVNLNYRFK
ncbi:MAG: hypothetical protein IPO60_00430 [Flavobacteriales bacterium]|jgi:hypothetical protein|nr:hypothetical protein [Flavobacteriales bacterium]MBK6892930.1 hypothetical protein [Flavobacteriales bacterium]MBK7247442.1 hypothetical protein [Flavobacteriales bacterium]MBK7286351.1 hypothetical protein [Flavobacteriales bacterium]MBK9061317.1 hypothetical protein [Flavobacteriales bacterium]